MMRLLVIVILLSGCVGTERGEFSSVCDMTSSQEFHDIQYSHEDMKTYGALSGANNAMIAKRRSEEIERLEKLCVEQEKLNSIPIVE